MGVSTLKGNSGYLGLDRRSTQSVQAIGTMSIQKHYLERRNDRLEPIGELENNILFSDNFETGDFSKWLDWTGGTGVRNATVGTPNTWNVGTGVVFSGSNSAYISGDGGTTYNYVSDGSLTTQWNSHIFIDFPTLPTLNSLYGITGLTLSVYWNCNAPDVDDYGYITFAPKTVLAGFPAAGVGYTGARIGALTNSGRFDTNYVTYTTTTGFHHEVAYINGNTTAANYWNEALTGGTGRLVFSWTNDANQEGQPPFAIDNVLITFHPCPPGTVNCY